MTWLNWGCGTWRAPEPWVNVDLVEREDVHPDVIVPFDGPYPWPEHTVERIYCGHVLEHVPWPDVLGLLQRLRGLLVDGGHLFAVGPDVLRTIERYKRDLEPEFMMHTVLEYHDANTGFVSSDWPNARHWWNCWQDRLAEVMRQAGFAIECIAPPEGVVERDFMPPWPVVGAAPWQCFVMGVR